jgi:hypothetical protein
MSTLGSFRAVAGSIPEALSSDAELIVTTVVGPSSSSTFFRRVRPIRTAD